MRVLTAWRDGLGLYSFSAGEFSESGVDPDAIVVASWGVADEADWAARKQDKQDKKVDGRASRVVRHRFVIKTLDGDKLVRATVAILAGSNISVANFVRGRGEPSLPDWAAAGEVKALAKKHGILVPRARARRRAHLDEARGRARDRRLRRPVGGRRRRGQGRGSPARSRRWSRRRRRRSRPSLEKGTRKLLSTEDVSIALVVEPSALGALLPRASCRKDWMAPESALFDDAAVLLRLHPFSGASSSRGG